ncbi:hypothetical protein C823_005137 [Eubacterium plexicaudatum ASF492]|uniref:Uncharacterized protein n=1 Tax=Eubacterium plexicaudatum ASF492 TaxID=1235802 RepID=N2A3W3_9FIRM|nr:hypothetical protein C823_005137 [Eubacterium plexicaudatum ASF492]
METLKSGVEEQLGFEVGERQFQKSLHNAGKKLYSIISRYGDADGRRREPEYLQELICEDIKASVLAEATMLMAVNMRNMEKERLADCRGTHVSTHIVAWECK